MDYFNNLQAVEGDKVVLFMCDKHEQARLVHKRDIMRVIYKHKKKYHDLGESCSMRDYTTREVLTTRGAPAY